MTQDRTTFFVQEVLKGPWHVESDDDCEAMLCGVVIPVDGPAKVQYRRGPRWCPDCWIILQRLRKEGRR